jgi:hypothetical protein
VAGKTSGVRKSKADKGETPESSHKDRPIDASVLHDTHQSDSDLAAVVGAWPDLPEKGGEKIRRLDNLLATRQILG